VVEGKKKIEIAKFVAKSDRESSGVLVIDEREVDELVGVMSCVAFLGQRDSFSV